MCYVFLYKCSEYPLLLTFKNLFSLSVVLSADKVLKVGFDMTKHDHT